MEPSAQKTPLYDAHVSLGGKMVPFAGYALPVQYPKGVIAEHMAVRCACGIFDVSHMGEISFGGPGALKTLNTILTNDFTNLDVGRCRYSLMCTDEGGVIDDLIIYRRAEQSFLAVVNAANREKDVAWMKAHLADATSMEDVSDATAQIAVQGPLSETICESIATVKSLPQKYYSFTEGIFLNEKPCLVSRTGYTGEDGFEIYCKPQDALCIWNALLAAGGEEGLIPCGLGSRDTLRLEAAMPLYGHEMDETITPFDTGLAFGVKLHKGEFIGKSALSISHDSPLLERIGLKVCGRGIVREHAKVYKGQRCIGRTTSGTYCPGIECAVAMALVDAGILNAGDDVVAVVRNRDIACKVVPLPFYKRKRLI